MTSDDLKVLETIPLDDLDIEIWKTLYIPDLRYEYQISNYGRFRNKTTGNLIKPLYTLDEKGKPGRYRVCMYTTTRKIPAKFLVNRLVALYFVENPNPKENIEVDHVDGNYLNNHYTNLEWVTPEENKRRATEMGLRRKMFGELNGTSIWKYIEVDFITNLISNGIYNYHILYDKYDNTNFGDNITKKSKDQLKNLYYNLMHKTNPKWTEIRTKYGLDKIIDMSSTTIES